MDSIVKSESLSLLEKEERLPQIVGALTSFRAVFPAVKSAIGTTKLSASRFCCTQRASIHTVLRQYARISTAELSNLLPVFGGGYASIAALTVFYDHVNVRKAQQSVFQSGIGEFLSQSRRRLGVDAGDHVTKEQFDAIDRYSKHFWTSLTGGPHEMLTAIFNKLHNVNSRKLILIL